MPEASHNDTAPRNPEYRQGASPTFEPTFSPESSLPPGDIYGSGSANRSAEAIGHRLGTAIFQVRQIPRRIDTARYRLRRAGDKTRANASARALQMMDAAADRAEDLRRSTQRNLETLADRAGSRASEMGDRAAARWREIRHVSENRLHEARRRAEAQWIDARRRVEHWQREDPVRFLAVVAGSAFVVGAALRIWRSNHE
jgi:hypothetical protein